MSAKDNREARATAAAEVSAVADLLRRKVPGCGLSQKEVERRLGWGEGYLSQVLTGKVDLKFHHFFAVLEVLRVSPRDFFAELRGAAALKPVAGPAPSRAAEAVGHELGGPWQGSREELRAFVVDVVQELFSGKRKSA